MSRMNLLVVAILATVLSRINAECANACNGHGKCVGYDMCICNRNWQANDCSERVCMHGLAHVDTPKGDLDMSGAISQPGAAVVVDNSFQFPYGTTEQFPQMEDSDLAELTQSAHYYMECSNKGTCDRSTGLCECFDGYDGVACQRASCPGFPDSCSGHGVCKSASQLASADSGNVYKLWNKDSTMGCECDSGYFGADCSERSCKVGVDPLYLDDSSTVKYSIYDFATLTTASTPIFNDGHPTQGTGYWAIRFFDHSGEDWITTPIAAGASCETVMAALEGLPNEVIPAGSLECTKTSASGADSVNDNTVWNSGVDVGAGSNRYNKRDYKINYQMSIWDSYMFEKEGGAKTTELGNSVYGPLLWMPGSKSEDFTGGAITRDVLSGHIYRIKFFGNPGKLREPEIVTHLDGKRNSLMSATFSGTDADPSASYGVITKVWTDGQQGEDKDYFADHCDGVTVTISTDDTVSVGGAVANMVNANPMTVKYYRLVPGNNAQIALLKKCLGDSDATSTNNVEIYNWDYGSNDYPHLIKLVRSVTTSTDGGYYVALIFDGTTYFNLLNPFVPPDALLTDSYEVYTTKGTLSRVSRMAQAHFGFAQKSVITTNTAKAFGTGNAALWDGDLSCEVGANNGFRLAPSVYIADVGITETDQYDLINAGELAVSGDTKDLFISDYITEWEYNYQTSPHSRKPTKFHKNCLNKTDIITFLAVDNVQFNPQHINLYTIDRLVQDKNIWSESQRHPSVKTSAAGLMGASDENLVVDPAAAMAFGTNVISLDMSTNWATTLGKETEAVGNIQGTMYVYKFVPAAESTYEYVAECSNRGICERDTGVCACFAGYTSDNCHEQSSLAL